MANLQIIFPLAAAAGQVVLAGKAVPGRVDFHNGALPIEYRNVRGQRIEGRMQETLRLQQRRLRPLELGDVTRNCH